MTLLAYGWLMQSNRQTTLFLLILLVLAVFSFSFSFSFNFLVGSKTYVKNCSISWWALWPARSHGPGSFSHGLTHSHPHSLSFVPSSLQPCITAVRPSLISALPPFVVLHSHTFDSTFFSSSFFDSRNVFGGCWLIFNFRFFMKFLIFPWLML